MKPRPWLLRRVPMAAALVVTVIATGCAGPGVPSGRPAAIASSPPSATTSPPATAPSPDVSPNPSIDPTDAAEPTPLPAPIPSGTDDPIVNRSIATVVVDALHLRAGPGTSTKVRSTLPIGTRLFVVGAPEVSGDLRWHRVSVVDPNGCALECVTLGWVATPATGTARWITNTPIACPASPMSAEDLMLLMPFERLHCYGSRDLTVTGWIDTPCCSGVSPLTYSPGWLAWGNTAYFRPRSEDGGATVDVHFLPGSGAKLPTTTVIMRATGHFDDPASTTCEASIDPAFEDDVDIIKPSHADMVLYCRSRLVITDYEVVGYLPGGGCGCLPPSPKPAA